MKKVSSEDLKDKQDLVIKLLSSLAYDFLKYETDFRNSYADSLIMEFGLLSNQAQRVCKHLHTALISIVDSVKLELSEDLLNLINRFEFCDYDAISAILDESSFMLSEADKDYMKTFLNDIMNEMYNSSKYCVVWGGNDVY